MGAPVPVGCSPAVLATINFSLFLMVIAKADASSKRQAQLAALLRTVQLLPFTLTAARQAAHIRLVLEQAGAPIGPHDIQIAGTALAHGATLVTHNHHAFARVPGLLLTDWYLG